MIEKYVDSKELKRLLSTLLVIVGCLIIAALFASLVVPGLRNANKPAKPTAVEPVVGESGWLDPTEFPVQRSRMIPPVDPETLIKPSAALTENGRILYEANCQTCHGERGQGDGPAGATLDPKPRDFAAAEGWRNGPEIPNIYKTLTDGIPGTSMAAYDYLTKRERMELLHYVQMLGGYAGREGNRDAMQALSEELASPGEKTTNKIPVSMAIAKLQSEFAPPAPILVSPDTDSPAAAILRRTMKDSTRAAQSLTDSTLWRTGPDALARSVLSNTPGNGFNVNVSALNPSEWQILYDELLKRIDE
jgi:mono/diheme cytochrome c family protein